MASMARCGFSMVGSTQHSVTAQGCVFTTSGGSTPTLRQTTRATLTVFIRSRIRQL